MDAAVRAGGREFPAAVIERIREVVGREPGLTRTELSRRVCQWLSWKQPNGRLREVSSRVALLELQRRRVIELPASQASEAGETNKAESKPAEWLLDKPAERLPSELKKLGPIELVAVHRKGCAKQYAQWKEALERFHPEGYVALPQAHVRYLIRSKHGVVLGALCFSAASRQVAARDKYIGWSKQARAANRELVVNNSRFLLLPWVRVKGLASHVLAKAARQMVRDWREISGLRPVLLETYVDAARYRATCYRAAGWQKVGCTGGYTRNNRSGKAEAAVRDIYVLALAGDFRQRLCSEPLGCKPAAEPMAGQGWVEQELAGVRLADKRSAKRLVAMLKAFYAKPRASIPQAFNGTLSAVKGAYRLLNNEKITMRDILAPHYASTVGRMQQEKVILAVQDTTSLNYSTHPATVGLGPITSKAEGVVGLEVHDTLAFTLQGVPLGLVDVQVWARDSEQFGKKHTRHQRPIEQKESYKWLASFQAAWQAQRECPNTRVVSVGDRESDVFELFELARAREDHPDLLVRATADRYANSAAATGRLWSVIEQQAVAGSYEVELPRTKDRPARRTQLSVRYAEVELKPPRNGPAGRLAQRLWAVLAREEQPPKGAEGVQWMLLSTMEVASFEQAKEKVDWYALRFTIEVYHHTLKSGCLIEERQLASAPGLSNCLALDMIVAWRILYMTRLGREVPHLPCTAVFTEDEWQALFAFTHRARPLPTQIPTLNEVIRMIAKLGGYLGRKADGAPGVQPIWIGLGRLSDIAECWCSFGPRARSP